VKIRQCPACYSVHEPAGVCPNCGHVYEADKASPKQVDGELQQITPEQAILLKRQKAKEVAKAQTLEQLEAIAKARGYKPGWARHVWNSRQTRGADNQMP